MRACWHSPLPSTLVQSPSVIFDAPWASADAASYATTFRRSFLPVFNRQRPSTACVTPSELRSLFVLVGCVLAKPRGWLQITTSGLVMEDLRPVTFQRSPDGTPLTTITGRCLAHSMQTKNAWKRSR